MSEKLKPCPFCGGEAALQYGRFYGNEFYKDYFCFCDECEASTTYFPTVAEAIEAWNRRVNNECQ